MKRAAITVLVFLAAGFAGVARAEVPVPTFGQILKMAKSASVVVPPEWDGVWSSVDTTYSCAGAFQSASASADTLCSGQVYDAGGSGSPITFQCTGTANATTIDVTCTGSGEVFTDCTVNYTIVTHGTLTPGSYFTVTTTDISYSGSGTGCEFLPPSCTQRNSHGTKLGSAPADYCSTPTRRPTWGHLKSIYR